ncbi:serine hydrolase domain-containing protein [Hymenobacter sp. CRA2]|uniref:serine hydrolase domain-containing protein n=1 Tax=Hymenobacter sp. CRA2 TaxID=1955620 RepID=UPI00098F4D4E|nr:serine hydrolase [Hymenobacter sp. CRA2]OON68559.1 serine hydrolase [Hymenobacter sp. CRA2]
MRRRASSPTILLLLALLCLLQLPAAQAQKKSIGPKKGTAYFPPPGSWETRQPEAVGLNPARLQEAVQYAQANESKAPRDLRAAHYESAFGREPFGYPVGPMKERGPQTGLIIRKGYLVAQWGEPQRVDLTFSVAKSFLSTVVGLAYQDGLIKSLDDKVGPYMAPIIPFQPWNTVANKADELGQQDLIELFNTEHNRKISWDHLLRQTSDWEGTLWGKPDWADRPQGPAAEWQTRPRHAPGTVYKYNDTRVNVLALAALNLWRRPLPQVLKERIMDPIGASPTWRWTGYENSWVVLDGVPVQSVSGGSHWGGGLFISALDQARFGLLTLRGGRWNGRQLISADWLQRARTPTPVQPTYGFMNYFLNTDKKLYPSAPASAFAHLGAGANIIYVDAEHDLVIVTRWMDDKAMDGLIQRVLQSMEK